MSKPFSKISKVSAFTFFKNALRILKNPLPFHHENFSKHGDTFHLGLGLGKMITFSRDAEFLKYVLQDNNKNYTKSLIQTRDLAKYIGKGLLTAQGDHWKKQRKLVQPAFYKKHIVSLLSTINQTILETIQKIPTNSTINAAQLFSDLAFRVVVNSLFSNGVSVEQIKRLQHITEEVQVMLIKELRQPYLLWYFKSSGLIKRKIKLSEESRSILKTMVLERKQSGARKDDLLDLLLESRYEDGTSMTIDHLIDEILILFVAGHETTASALSFTCELLATYPEHQKLIREEVLLSTSKNTDLASFIKACPYTKQVVEESMRLFPPAYFIDRINIKKDTFKGNEFAPNSNLLFSIHEIHRNPKYWDDPLVFNPNRFSPSNFKANRNYYFPFGAGPRMCIGNNFAMYEMILTIAQLIEKFQITSPKKQIDINPAIILKPKNAVLLFTQVHE